MIWVIGILLFVAFGLLIAALLQLRAVNAKLQKVNVQLTHLTDLQVTRQARIAMARSVGRPPGVDAAARTTRRDSHDLPLTGRQGRIAIRRTDQQDQPEETPEESPWPS